MKYILIVLGVLLLALGVWAFGFGGWQNIIQPMFAQAPATAAPAEALAATEAPVEIEGSVDTNLYPATGADLRSCADVNIETTFDDIVGPLDPIGKDLGATDFLEDNWLYVKDSSGNDGWISESAVKGTLDMSKLKEMDGSCESVEIVELAPAVVDATCSLTDGNAQLQLTKSGNEWVADPNDLKVVAGYDNTQPGHDVNSLGGCDIWWEYESPTEKKHIIKVGRDDPGTTISFLGDDGLIHIPQPKGGSLWVGPSEWNTADSSTQKPSIALEMAAEKRVNQIRNDYKWVIELYHPDGTMESFPTDHVFAPFYSGCTDLETSPARIHVAGTIVDDKFNASIGMEGCPVAVKLDGQWTFWHDAKDNILYTTAEAWLFKSGTTDDEVQEWIDSQ